MKYGFKGSITIFLLIIFMAFVVFTGTIIDIVRITLAEVRFEGALEASIRSILAGYNKTLVGEFGIMGIDTQQGDYLKSELNRYLRVNLMEQNKGISFVSCQIDSAELMGIGNLTNQALLKQQILEYMKYRAPALITENIYTKLKEAKLDKSVEFAEKAKDARTAQKHIEEKIDKLNSKISDISEFISKKSSEGLENIYKELIELKSIAEDFYEADSLEDYMNADNTLKNMAEQESFEHNSLPQYEKLNEEARNIAEKADRLIAKLEAQREAVKELENNINNLEIQKSQTESKIRELNGKLQEAGSLSEEQNLKIKDEIERLIAEKEHIQTEIDRYKAQIDEIMSLLSNEVSVEGLTIIELNAESKDEPEHGQDKEAAVNSKIDEIKGKLLMKTIDKDMLITVQELYDAVIKDNMQLENMYQNTGVLRQLSQDEGESSNDGILEFLKQLSNAVSLEAQGTRDKLYVIEYIMDKFTFLTSNTVRSHYFAKGEVEYILSGRDIPYDTGGNTELKVITATIAKLWFLRFALDSIDNFVYSKIPHPLTRLIWSLVEGSIDASTDMFHLLNGDGVNLSPSISNIKLKYSDHLRILLIMQSEEETLRRVQQLIQVNIRNEGKNENKDFRLKNCSTSIKAEAEAKVNLWFLPLLNIDKLGYSSIREGHYVLKKSIYLGY